jgi:hypothetical protein
MASQKSLILRSGRSPRLEGRTTTIQPTDAATCRMSDALIAVTALTAIGLTICGGLP